MKKLIVHVGPHKTGTTYLQNILEHSEEILREQGYEYPRLFYMAKGQHHLVTYLLQGKLQEFREECRKINESDRNIIVSSENFIHLNRSHFEKFKEIFHGKRVEVVFFFRNPTQRFVSYWKETVKHGGTDSFFKYFSTEMMRPFFSRQINTLNFLNDLEKVFGKESLKIVDFDSAKKEGTILDLFEDVVGAKLNRDVKKVINKSLDIEEIELIRYLNTKAKKNGQLKGSNIREKYFRKINRSDFPLDELKKIMGRYRMELGFGNLFIDKKIIESLSNKYKENVVNSIMDSSNSKSSLLSDEWVFDEKISDLVRELEGKIIQGV